MRARRRRHGRAEKKALYSPVLQREQKKNNKNHNNRKQDLVVPSLQLVTRCHMCVYVHGGESE